MGRGVNMADWEIKIKRYVLETEGVSRITDYQANFDADTRKLTILIDYQDIYGQQQTARYDA